MSLIKGSTSSPSPPGQGSVIPVKVDSDGHVYVSSESGSEVLAQVADDSASGGPYYLLSDTDGALMLASHTSLTASDRVEEIDPVSQHYAADQDSATGQGNTAPALYYYYDMAGYKYFSVQVDDTAGVAGNNTYTVEATIQDDGTAPASCTYTDVTNALYGVANLVADGMLHPSIPLVCKFVRVKVVRAADGGNVDGAWVIDSKRMY